MLHTRFSASAAAPAAKPTATPAATPAATPWASSLCDESGGGAGGGGLGGQNSLSHVFDVLVKEARACGGGGAKSVEVHGRSLPGTTFVSELVCFAGDFH